MAAATIMIQRPQPTFATTVRVPVHVLHHVVAVEHVAHDEPGDHEREDDGEPAEGPHLHREDGAQGQGHGPDAVPEAEAVVEAGPVELGQADGARDPRQVGADHDADGGERHDHGVAVVAGGGGHEALTPRVGRQRLAGQLRVVRLGLVRERPEEVDDDHPRSTAALRRRRGDGRLGARLGIGAERDAGNGVAGGGCRAGLRFGDRSRQPAAPGRDESERRCRGAGGRPALARRRRGRERWRHDICWGRRGLVGRRVGDAVGPASVPVPPLVAAGGIGQPTRFRGGCHLAHCGLRASA